LLQADHALSGIDVALWDLLGKVVQEPVYQLLGFSRAYPKRPYYSLLFGSTPSETLMKAKMAWQQGFTAIKFGWGPFGQKSLRDDVDQVVAAREGLGKDGILCIDAGTVWENDLEEAVMRLDILQKCNVTWLEEPFHTGALKMYHELARRSGQVKLAGGEGAHNEYMAQQMIDYAGIGYIQVDTGRIGGITSAKRVFDHAQAKGVKFVNHTFTSHLALSASLQAYAGAEDHVLCEYPGQLSPLAHNLTQEHLELDQNGNISLPASPGLGINLDPAVIHHYLVDTQVIVNGHTLYQTPTL
jgi:L-alanine-DL-glutamate epimerase-like enolase superfamily enzyme